MHKFKHAIVRTPGKSLTKGLTTASLGTPDYKNALSQHAEYIKALKKCGLDVIVLPPDEDYPDSVFVEDVALMTTYCAILTNPGAVSRKGEVEQIKKTVDQYYTNIETIHIPGTLEAGDVMMVGNHYFIGLSERTNQKGAVQLIRILEKNGMSGSIVRFEKVLHLKTGLAYLENNNLLACGEFVDKPEFQKFNIIDIPQEESYAANSIWVNGTVIMPKGFPKTKQLVQDAGYKVDALDVSEYQKLDGGVSCLSLRF